MQWILSKVWKKEENQKIRLKKKWNEASTKEKMICRKGCKRNNKTKPAQLQEERREREVKIRKNTVVYWKRTHVGWLNGFPCSLSAGQAGVHAAPPRSHMLRQHGSESKLNMKNHWGLWPSHTCLNRGGAAGLNKLPLDEPFQPHHCSKERPRAASPHPPWSQVKQRQGRSAYCLHLLQVLSTWWSPRMKSNQTHTRNLGSFPLLVGQKKCTEVRRLLRHVLSACPPKWQWWHKAELPGYRRWPVRTRWRWVGRRARAPGSSQVLLGFPSGTWKPGNGPAGNVPSWWEYFPCCKHWTVTSPARAVWRGGHCGS